MDQQILDRAQGCLMGQLVGDSLGSLVEFMGPEEIRARYPGGVTDLEDGGVWGTLAGQPTDDSELALALARTLVRLGRYDDREVFRAYVTWLHSRPFDLGSTVSAGLQGHPNHYSQSNGAMMRASPLGIFAAGRGQGVAEELGRRDALLTHPNPVCVQANQLYVEAVAAAIRDGLGPSEVYDLVLRRAGAVGVEPGLMETIDRARTAPPEDYLTHQGWVLVAFGNALWQLLHAADLEQGVVDTVGRGGDTDTNGAICGALLGAVHGLGAIPRRWVDAVLACRPDPADPRVRRPRPEEYWPTDSLDLAVRLLGDGGD